MKKITFIVIALLITGFTYAQTTWDEAGIRKASEEFATLTGEGKMGEAMLKYTHPKLFEKVLEMSGQEMPLEEFTKMVIEQAAASLNDSTMEMQLSNFKIEEIGELINHENVLYALVKASSTITIIYKETDDSTDLLEISKNMFEAKYGAENVTVDKEKKTIIINSTSDTLAIGDQSLDNWKIMEYKKDQLIMFEIMPKAVAEKLNTDK